MIDERLRRSLEHSLGPVIMDALADPNVVEIFVNPDGRLWVERLGEPMKVVGEMSAVDTARVISLIASSLEESVARENPIVEGELPLDGSRFEGLLNPVVPRPIFNIRKKADRIFTLAEYENAHIMSPAHHWEIRCAIESRKNILVVGGTGSGKTTLVNGIIDSISDMCPGDRLVVIEDTCELQSSGENTVFLRSTTFVPIATLVRATMRLRPDRILVGEVRGGEALELLKAWNTGHPGGVATVHANSARGGLFRLEQLVAEASRSPMPSLIGEAVDLVVFIRRTSTSRKVAEVVRVSGFDAVSRKYTLEFVDA